MTSKILISVVGPTAIGKTKLAIALAKHYNTEVLSADSRQFYKEMSIGTAVPKAEELAAVKHHFIQHKSITEDYSVGDFEREAIALLDTLFEHHDIVIMVGGSGLYVDAITKGLDEFPAVTSNIREELNQELKELGIASLQKKLKTLDKTYYDKVDLNNPHRLIRALEICIGTGKPYTSFLNQPKKKRNFKTITVGLHADRQIVYDNINRRVDIMIAQGLVKEAKTLLSSKHLNALQTVGYKELFNYFEDTYDYEMAVSEIKKNTRRFAKRQLTWFKKNQNTLWLNALNSSEQHLENIAKTIQKQSNT